MADVLIKVLEPAETNALMTPEQARLWLQLQTTDPMGSDDFLNFLIETNSDVISTMCNRVFARERVRETWRCLGEPCDCEDAKSSRRLFLSHWPVKEDDVESVEVPRGYPMQQDCWELDERAGRLSVFCGTAEPIVVTYTGGFQLPEEAPPALRYALALLVGDAKATAQREGGAFGAGIRQISHKESRVTFHAPTAESAASQRAGGAESPKMTTVKNLLSHFTRLWI
jgi:hypothetical protein